VLCSVYLLLTFTFVVLVGTLFVPLSTMILGRTMLIGPTFYNYVLMPIGILLLGATALVPLLRWGTAPDRVQRTGLLISVLGAGVATGVAAWIGIRHLVALSVAGLAALAVCALLIAFCLDAVRHSHGGFWRGVVPALGKHRRQYAAYVIHLAFVCLAVGITGSSIGTRRYEVQSKEGDIIEWAGWRIEYVRLIQRESADKLIAEVELRVGRGNNPPVTLMPARHFHLLQNQWTTEVAIHSSWATDFYTILDAGLGDGQVALTFVENPLMRWIWMGGWLAAGGVIVVAWPTRQKQFLSEEEYGNPAPSPAVVPTSRSLAA